MNVFVKMYLSLKIKASGAGGMNLIGQYFLIGSPG